MTNEEAAAVTFEQSGHEEYVCPPERKNSESHIYCQFCEGGLFACKNCNSFEGATTTHCPGEPMSYDMTDLVYAGKADYRDGAWVAEGSPHTPNRGWELSHV